MNRLPLLTISALAVLGLTGCVGTATGLVCGTATGGASLTSATWQGDSNVATKIILTPATLIGGTIGGFGSGTYDGFKCDMTALDLRQGSYPINSMVKDACDPFGAGFFKESEPKYTDYIVHFDDTAIGVVTPAHPGNAAEALALALKLEEAKTKGIGAYEFHGCILNLTSAGKAQLIRNETYAVTVRTKSSSRWSHFQIAQALQTGNEAEKYVAKHFNVKESQVLINHSAKTIHITDEPTAE